MYEHAQELIATINNVVPPAAPEAEGENAAGSEGEIEYEDEDDDAMQM